MKASKTKRNVIKITQVCCLGILILTPLAYAKLTGSLSVEAITERLQPLGKVNVEGADAAAAREQTAGAGMLTPQGIYDNNCKMCHQTGVAGAPKLGNKADWAPRMSQGLDALVKAAWLGIRAMPPKGNCLNCTEDQIKATVEYMTDAVK